VDLTWNARAIMKFWSKPKKASSGRSSEAKQAPKSKKKVKRSPSVALEVKLLALEALESGVERYDVAELVGVTESTLDSWRRQYQEGGVQGLSRRRSVAQPPRVIGDVRIVKSSLRHNYNVSTFVYWPD
jgi:hypothetical protein